MTARFIDTAVDLIWPSLDGDANEHAAQERERLDTEMQAIKQDVTKLRPNEDELKGYLAASEKLLETENSRKGGIESRLLNAAGLVSIAGTDVLGALFSLACEKLTLSAPWARITLTLGCLYLAVQLVAALHAAIKGLQARGYFEDLPHELLPRDGLKRTAYRRERLSDCWAESRSTAASTTGSWTSSTSHTAQCAISCGVCSAWRLPRASFRWCGRHLLLQRRAQTAIRAGQTPNSCRPYPLPAVNTRQGMNTA